MKLLPDNPIVQELLDILENEGKAALQHLDLSCIDQVFDQTRLTARGRPRIYPPSTKLNTLLYGLAEGRHTIRSISRAIKTSLALVFLDLKTGMSYATLDRFWTQFASLAEAAFKALAQMVANLGILGAVQAADSTSIATPLLNDPDAQWSLRFDQRRILLWVRAAACRRCGFTATHRCTIHVAETNLEKGMDSSYP